MEYPARWVVVRHLSVRWVSGPWLSPASLLVLAALLFGLPGTAWGQYTYTWKSDITTGQWTGSNWQGSGGTSGGGIEPAYAGYPGDPVSDTSNANGNITDRAVIGAYNRNAFQALGIDMGSTGTGGGLHLASLTFDSSSGDLTINNSSTTTGYLRLGGSTISGVDNTLIAVQGSSNLTITNGSGTLTLDLGHTSGVFQVASGRTLTVASGITESGGTSSFTVQGGGTMILTGGNSYTGVTTIAASTTLQVGNGGTLGSGTVTNNGTLSFNRTTNYAFAGNISGVVDGVLVQAGSGTTTLSGSNSYGGTTSVSAGTLLVNGTHTGTGAITVAGGTLGGTGSLAGATTVQSGGTIRGGSDAGTGQLSVGNTTVESGGTLFANLAAVDENGAGTGSKLALGSNSLDLKTGSVLRLDDVTGFNMNTPGTYVLATFSSGDSILADGTGSRDGSFDFGTYIHGTTPTRSGVMNIQLASGFSLEADDRLELRRSGNNLVLTFSPAPEPGALLAVCGLAAGGVALVRRLRRKSAEVTPAA